MPPGDRELGERRHGDRRARLAPCEPALDVLFRPEEVHRPSGEDDVVPPARGRDEAVEDEALVVGTSVADLDLDRARRSRGSSSRSARRCWSAAQMPNASHAQFAYHRRPSASTTCGVGTPENGFAIRSASVIGSSTIACASCSRRQPAITSSTVVPSTVGDLVCASARGRARRRGRTSRSAARCRVPPLRHSPVNSGRRFSTKASTPSRKSCVCRRSPYASPSSSSPTWSGLS